jgi:hypothetical protein
MLYFALKLMQNCLERLFVKFNWRHHLIRFKCFAIKSSEVVDKAIKHTRAHAIREHILRVWHHHEQIEGQDVKNVSNGSPVQWAGVFLFGSFSFLQHTSDRRTRLRRYECAPPVCFQKWKLRAARRKNWRAVRWICCLMLTLLLISAAALM